jgi:predicted enzyme related to lactoylglutathione lyase
MANPVVHFEIAGSDAAKSRDFYGKLFGWEYQMFQGDYGIVSPAGENSIGGGVFGVDNGTKPYVTFYVMVDDLAASLAHAERLGGKACMPPTPIGEMGSIAMFSDPDGNLVGLFKAAQKMG